MRLSRSERAVLWAAVVALGYVALIGYTRAVYEMGWDARGVYEEELNQDWPEPQPEIET